MHNKPIWRDIRTVVPVVLIVLYCGNAWSTPSDVASQILSETGVKGGLIVHVGCENGELTAALGSSASKRYLVQGLDTNPENVAQARAYIRSLGLYGSVTVEHWSGSGLPYIDNLVNLIVAENLTGVTTEELLRVLTPHGVAFLKSGDTWYKYVKPRPDWIDEWTHYLHDPTNSAVAHDEAIHFPRRLQWTGSPRWARHHDHMGSTSALVSSNGRIFYIMDKGSRTSIVLPSRWTLVARDAFNGTILWDRPISEWHIQLWRLKSGLGQLPRRLVAIGDTVYVTPGYRAPLFALDAATGGVLNIYPQTMNAEEFLYLDGVLYIQINDSPFSKTYSTLAEVKTDSRAIWWNGETRRIMAIDATTGNTLWEIERPVTPLTLAANSQYVFFFDGDRVICLNRANGSQVWQSDPIPRNMKIKAEAGPRLVLYEDVVLFAGNEDYQDRDDTMRGLSIDTGDILWTANHPPTAYRSIEDIHVVKGRVWAGATFKGALSGIFTGRDPLTGAVQDEFGPDVETHWFHHRCHVAKATDNYILTSRTGIEFVDPETHHWTIHHWTRGGCLYGILPCNGFIYTPPHNCACYTEAKTFGWNALAPDDSDTTINRGPNLVLNAGFESGSEPWQYLPESSGNAERYLTEESGYVGLMRIPTAGETGHLRQNMPIVAGTPYVVYFDTPAPGQPANLVSQFEVTLGGTVQTLNIEDGRVEGVIEAGSGEYLQIKPIGDPGDFGMVDNVNVRETLTFDEPITVPASPLAALNQPISPAPRLERRTAYGIRDIERSDSQTLSDWPTYRNTTARSGCTTSSVYLGLQHEWETEIGGRLSSLTAANGKIFVSSVDAHTIYALDALTGEIAWNYMVGGRVDSPPTYYKGTVIFGCADGWIYCLRASDGDLVWRYRGASQERCLVAWEQVESVWPLHGSVLVVNGVVYCVSGRSMFLDGGLRFIRLNAETGQALPEVILDDRDPVSTTESLQIYVDKLDMTVALPDILSYDDRYIYMRSMPFDLEGTRQYLACLEPEDQVGEYTHLFAPGSFVDDYWMHRHYWVYGQTYASGAGGYYKAGLYTPCGRILCHDDSHVYGFGRKSQYYKWTTPLEYRLFRSQIQTADGGSTQGKSALPDPGVRRSSANPVPNAFLTDWSVGVPILVRAMALAGNALFIAGLPDVVNEEEVINSLDDAQIYTSLLEQEEAWLGNRGGVLRAVSTDDGGKLEELELDSPPVWDGMIAAHNSLYIATMDGTIICLKGIQTRLRDWHLFVQEKRRSGYESKSKLNNI